MPPSRNPWLRLSLDTLQLGVESQGVMMLRLAKFARDGLGAKDEAVLMVREKIDAALDAHAHFAASALSGAGAQGAHRTMAMFRRRVRANHRRLSKR
jgi:hypothetical protein